jgi:hypothetical protein
MAKKPQTVVMPKEKNVPMIVKAGKVAIGLTHIASHRCGAHDNRPKRLRTRAAQKAAWKTEF